MPYNREEGEEYLYRVFSPYIFASFWRSSNAKRSDYQASLKTRILRMFPDAVIYKNGIGVPQGFPDLMILYKDKWAALEVKRSEKEMKRPRPNQPKWVERLNGMSFASFVYPENEKEVLDGLYQSFEGKPPGTCGVRRE